jgi:PAB-dependent poly(A)-specific ribonuclease subunit 2
MVKVFDVRTFKPLPSVPFEAGPAFVLAHPKNPSSLVVASAQGMFQTTDLLKPGEASFHQVSAGRHFTLVSHSWTDGLTYQLDITSYLTAAAISASGAYLAFGDADGSTHVWTTDDAAGSASTFNGYEGIEPDWPLPPAPLPQIPWTTDT